jgi:hypothetical protein
MSLQCHCMYQKHMICCRVVWSSNHGYLHWVPRSLSRQISGDNTERICSRDSSSSTYVSDSYPDLCEVEKHRNFRNLIGTVDRLYQAGPGACSHAMKICKIKSKFVSESRCQTKWSQPCYLFKVTVGEGNGV